MKKILLSIVGFCLFLTTANATGRSFDVYDTQMIPAYKNLDTYTNLSGGGIVNTFIKFKDKNSNNEISEVVQLTRLNTKYAYCDIDKCYIVDYKDDLFVVLKSNRKNIENFKKLLPMYLK